MIDYNGKVFRPVSTSDNGEVDGDTRFHYRQAGRIVQCDYAGGSVVAGHLVGVVDDAGCIDMRYHQVNTQGVLMTGTCQSRPERLPDGRLRLHETWQWTSGDGSAGRSVLEEVRD